MLLTYAARRYAVAFACNGSKWSEDISISWNLYKIRFIRLYANDGLQEEVSYCNSMDDRWMTWSPTQVLIFLNNQGVTLY